MLLPLIVPKQTVSNTLNFVNNCFQSGVFCGWGFFFPYKMFKENWFLILLQLSFFPFWIFLYFPSLGFNIA